MGKASALASALGKKLQSYQEQNRKKYESQAAREADSIINGYLAQGMSFEDIERQRQAGNIPRLDTVLKERSFNYAFGAAAATNYLTVGKGAEDYKRILDDYKSQPFNQRQTFPLEQHIARITNQFRSTNAQNLDLANGASTVLAKWSKEKRDEFVQVREQLDDSARVQTAATNLYTMLQDFAEIDQEEGRDSRHYYDNFHGRLETSLEEFSRNNNVPRAYFKQIKLNLVKDIIINAKVSAANGRTQDAIGQFNIAMHALEGSTGQVPSLLLDKGLYTTLGNTGEKGTKLVRDEALALFNEAQKAKNKLKENDNSNYLADKLVADLRAGKSVGWYSQVQGSTIASDGVEGKRDKIKPLAINKLIASVSQETDATGNPIASLDKKIKIFSMLSRIGEDEGLNYYKGEFDNFKSILNGGNKDQIFSVFWNNDGKESLYETYQALKILDPTLVDHYLPVDDPMRRFFETFNAQRVIGKINAENIKEQLQIMWSNTKDFRITSANKKNIDDALSSIDNDIAKTGSFGDANLPPYMRGRLRQILKHRAELIYNSYEGDGLVDILKKDIIPRLVGFSHNGVEHVLMARSPKNMELLKDLTLPAYLAAQMDEFAARNKIPRDELSITNDPINGDRFMYIHAETGTPIGLSYSTTQSSMFIVKPGDAARYAAQVTKETIDRRQGMIAEAVRITKERTGR
tara:strand:- start:11980 stop:14052 length:2073 start_codon:yes stop_codon:yes gene_type:complete